MPRSPIPAVLLILALTAPPLTPIPAIAQVPDEYTNLQILPEDVSKRDLMSTMRGFAGALGVRCAHCHVGPDDLVGMDFATDELSAKQAARRMMRMVQAINGDHLEQLPEAAREGLEVTCQTCHRSLTRPVPIEDVVAEKIASDGIGAGISHYRELRDEYYGRAAYDFGPQPLNTLSERLFFGGQQDEAIALTRANNELHPQYAWSRSLLGRFYSARGDTAQAIAAFEEALALEPDNEWLKAQIARLQQPAEGEPDEN